jgi:hypothetical protein
MVVALLVWPLLLAVSRPVRLVWPSLPLLVLRPGTVLSSLARAVRYPAAAVLAVALVFLALVGLAVLVPLQAAVRLRVSGFQ